MVYYGVQIERNTPIKDYLEGKRVAGVKLGSYTESTSKKRQVHRVGLGPIQEQKSYVLKFRSDIEAPFEDSDEYSLYAAVGSDWQENHLVTPLAYWQQPDKLGLDIVMPFVEGTSLHSFRKAQQDKAGEFQVPYEMSFLTTFADEVGKGLQTLRERGFLHGDFYPWNILITVNELNLSDQKLVLIDFERTKKMSAELKADKASEELLYFELLAEMLVTPFDLATVYTFFNALTKMYAKQAGSWRNIPIWVNAPSSRDDLVLDDHQLEQRFCQLQVTWGLVPTELGLHDPDLIKMLFLVDTIWNLYGETFAQFFAHNIVECLTNKNWNFTDFAAEFSEQFQELPLAR